MSAKGGGRRSVNPNTTAARTAKPAWTITKVGSWSAVDRTAASAKAAMNPAQVEAVASAMPVLRCSGAR